MPSNDRTSIATAAIGAALAGVVAASHPGLIPALTVALAAFVVLAALLRL
jgi:hypothetical protein